MAMTPQTRRTNKAKWRKLGWALDCTQRSSLKPPEPWPPRDLGDRSSTTERRSLESGGGGVINEVRSSVPAEDIGGEKGSEESWRRLRRQERK